MFSAGQFEELYHFANILPDILIKGKLQVYREQATGTGLSADYAHCSFTRVNRIQTPAGCRKHEVTINSCAIVVTFYFMGGKTNKNVIVAYVLVCTPFQYLVTPTGRYHCLQTPTLSWRSHQTEIFWAVLQAQHVYNLPTDFL